MRFTFEYCPWSAWFGYWRGGGGVSDMGDYVFWVFRIQITIFIKSNKYKPKKLFTWKETDR